MCQMKWHFIYWENHSSNEGKMLVRESARPLLLLITLSGPLIGCQALLKRKKITITTGERIKHGQ